MSSSSTRLRLGGALAATSVILVFGLGSTALADQAQGDEHRNERATGRPDPSPRDDEAPPAGETTPTEDTDTNDGTPNNVVDAGDDLHPSGKDRSVENGGSGNQGSAASEPDQNGRGPERDTGGLDKPGGPGGADLADQDGNNGCGNDDDFEDDNEGLCRKPRKTTTSPPVVEVEIDVEKDDETEKVVVESGNIGGGRPTTSAEVLGVLVERPAVAAASAETSPTPSAAVDAPSVLGATVVRSAALARTGLGIGSLVSLAGTLLLAGFAMVRRPQGAHYIA